MGNDNHRHPPSHTPVLANMVEPVTARSERSVERERASAGTVGGGASNEPPAARVAGQLETGPAKAAGGGGGGGEGEGGGGSEGEAEGGAGGG